MGFRPGSQALHLQRREFLGRSLQRRLVEGDSLLDTAQLVTQFALLFHAGMVQPASGATST
ncbi:hypothetical protein E4633_06875 [Geomonas terrae]|uniref:Uncharacterized protein n=1 Tax=Geomonas terrae TaxID=2562681 RepID=A0A4S1CMW9_9BACT|nr:hypothetical protein E4633_06875 [Geomonas terrae]